MYPIYVTGHRNPDTDSIVAAMAYAALRNAVGDREYEAACLGRVSDETEMVLKKFGFQPPKRINNMFTQVKDLDFDTPPVLNTGVTVGRAWDILQEQKNISAVPVVNEDGTLYGMLSRENVASYNMEQIASGKLIRIPCSTSSPLWRARCSTRQAKTPTFCPVRSPSRCPRAVRI